MPDGVFGLEIVTPEQSLVAGGAIAVVLATSEGALTVLDGHTPLIGDVVPGLVKVDQPDGTELIVAVHGGFVQVDTSPGAAEGLAEGDGPLPGLSTRVTMLAGIAELVEEIDVARAEAARDAATQRLSEIAGGRSGGAQESSEGAVLRDVELLEVTAALARAELRLAAAAGTAQ
jgi:F-type H+-transporting ATPase subunit epsilon